MSEDVLEQLVRTVRERRLSTGEKSYTRHLLDGGVERCAKKLGEEAFEVVIAALAQSDEALKGEAADLIYHLIVLLEARDIPLDDVLAVLATRSGRSGHDEKAGRASG
ncbi:MAG: phosphoribosyl-ATP diphosphatase [Hyphomicrobium sp.]|nr:phosphoribosyl-ATP diphosphatase [Hyphomicrobium sp.]